ncbi:retrovirus-related pol polyprotein from transposon TNT 1-94 [Tanacetum coccineum]
MLLRCPQHYLTDMQEVILFYKGLDIHTRQILDSKGAIPCMNAADAKKAIQEMADHSQKWQNGTSTRTRSTDTSDGLAVIQAQLNNLRRNIKKVNKKVYVAQVGCESCIGPHYTKDCPLKEEVLQERGSRSLPGSTKTNPRDYVKSISTTIETNTTSIPRIEGARYVVLDNQNIMQTFKPNQSTIPFPSRLTDDCYAEMNVFNSATYGVFEEGRRMKVPVERSMNEDILPQKEKHPGSFTLPCYINNVCFEKALADREASVSVMPLTTFTNLGLGGLALTKLTVELADRTIKYPKGVAENVIVGISKFVFPIDFIFLDMPEDVKVPLILGRPFLVLLITNPSVRRRNQENPNLYGIYAIEYCFWFAAKAMMVVWQFVTVTMMPACISICDSIGGLCRDLSCWLWASREDSLEGLPILMFYGYSILAGERMKLDLEVRLMGEALMINRSQDPSFKDFIELNDPNTPIELRRNQVEDLGPTIGEEEVIDKPMIDIIKTRNNESFDEYPSFCDFDGKIHIDCAYNLRFLCMIVVKNMDGYRDQDIGDVIFGEPLCKASCVEARRFE